MNKEQEIILSITKPESMTALSKKTNTTFNYVSRKIIPNMKKSGIIICKRKGRVVEISLTEKGRIYQELLKALQDFETKIRK